MPSNYAVAATTPHQQKVTAASTADVQTFTPPAPAHAFYIQVSGQDVYLTLDGTTPTSANGISLIKGTAPVFFGAAATLKVSPTAATAATVNVVWLI